VEYQSHLVGVEVEFVDIVKGRIYVIEANQNAFVS